MAESLNLARDCLDNRLVARGGAPIGRVDGIVMRLEHDGPPRLVAVEVGSVVLARRFSRAIARLATRLAQRFGRMPSDPLRIDWDAVTFSGRDAHVDWDPADAPTRAWERWCAERIVRRIPGSG